VIRESENLPESWDEPSRKKVPKVILRIKKGHPRIDPFDPGIFFCVQEGGVMHFYWRVMEELKYLGEVWFFCDPSLARAYVHWRQKNREVLP
jgi:hypothetical protein